MLAATTMSGESHNRRRGRKLYEISGRPALVMKEIELFWDSGGLKRRSGAQEYNEY